MNNTTTTPPNGYKNTAIGVIPDNWDVKKLGELGDTFSGLSGKNKDDFGKGYPYIPYKNIFQNSKIDINFMDYVHIKENEKQHKVQYGDIFFTTSSETADEVGMSSVLLDEIHEMYLNSFCFGFRLKNRDALDPLFSSYLLRGENIRKELNVLAQGSTRFNLSKSELIKLIIPIPPLPEQQKIAEILTTWDEAITNCKKTINTLKARNKGLAQQLLTGKKRVSGFSDKWEETTIEKITKYFSNKNKNLINARIYSVTNSNGFVYQSDHFSREVAGDDLTGYKIIKNNEFAYNPARINVGSIAFFTDEIGVISSLYVCFKTNEKVTNKFLIEWLKIDKTKHDIERYGEGGVRIYLWYDLFKKLKINLPSIQEQTAIAEVLETTDQELKNYQTKLEALQNQKKGLMQQLLTGKIRVNVK